MGGFRVEVTNPLGRAFEVGKQHRHLFALAFQGTARGQDFLGEIGRRVGKGARSGGLAGGASTTGVMPPSPNQTRPPCLVVHLRMGKEEFVLEIAEGVLVWLKLPLQDRWSRARAAACRGPGPGSPQKSSLP